MSFRRLDMDIIRRVRFISFTIRRFTLCRVVVVVVETLEETGARWATTLRRCVRRVDIAAALVRRLRLPRLSRAVNVLAARPVPVERDAVVVAAAVAVKLPPK